jgi:hypothetical protein
VIAYQLHCRNGHGFEGWFRDSAAFDAQSDEGRILCPTCNSKHVQKSVMAPAVQGTRKSKARAEAQKQQQRQYVTGLRRYVETHADYVGEEFAKEARRIHYGESPDRPIYGETSLEEAREMLEEGLDVAPLPQDPESGN